MYSQVEDCAHGMGCTWNGEQAGRIGDISVFSCQSDKVVNAGEGGFLTTNNPEWAAQCVYWSGACEYFRPQLPPSPIGAAQIRGSCAAHSHPLSSLPAQTRSATSITWPRRSRTLS